MPGARPGDPETLPAWLSQLARRHGNAEALVEPSGATRTFGELDDRVATLSETLAATGVGRGARVAYLLPNGVLIVEQFLAVTRLGALSLGISTRSRLHDIQTILRQARPTHLIAARSFLSADYQSMISEAIAGIEDPPVVLWSDRLQEPQPNGGRPADSAAGGDLAVAFTTSGTTGTPKLPAHTHEHVVAHLRAAARATRIAPGSTSLLTLPFCGTFGFVSAMSTLAGGARVVLPPRFTPESSAELVERFGITHLNGSDDMLIALTRQGRALRSWRYGVVAEFTSRGLQAVAAAEQLGARILGVYGSSETFALLAMRTPEDSAEQRSPAGGVLVSADMKVRIAGADDAAETSADVGEIQFRGPSIPDAYVRENRLIPPALTDDGWFATGDLGRLDGAGDFTYLGRSDDALRLAGFLVDPAEIERFLAGHPAVQQAQVVGSADREGREVAVAFVTARDVHEAQLLDYCRGGLANYKVPARIVTLDDLPAVQGVNGTKLQRSKLRELAADLDLS